VGKEVCVTKENVNNNYAEQMDGKERKREEEKAEGKEGRKQSKERRKEEEEEEKVEVEERSEKKVEARRFFLFSLQTKDKPAIRSKRSTLLSVL